MRTASGVTEGLPFVPKTALGVCGSEAGGRLTLELETRVRQEEQHGETDLDGIFGSNSLGML